MYFIKGKSGRITPPAHTITFFFLRRKKSQQKEINSVASVSDSWTSVCSDSLHLFVTLEVLIPRWWKKQYRFSSSLVNWNPHIGIRQLEKTGPEFPRHKQGNGEQETPAEHKLTTISGSNWFIDSASEDTVMFGQNQDVAFWWAVYDVPVWVWIRAARVSPCWPHLCYAGW